MTLNFLFPEEPVPPAERRLTVEQQRLVEIDTAIARSLFQQAQGDLSNIRMYREYYDGEQPLVYGTDKFKEFIPAFDGFEDNWCAVVVDAIAEKMKLLGIEIDRPEGSDSDTPDPRVKKIWDCFRRNQIDQQEKDLTEAVLVEGRAGVIVWKDEELGVRIDWQPAETIAVRYSEEDYRVIDYAVKRWRTPRGEIRLNIYDKNQVRKYVEGKEQKPATLTNTSAQVSSIPVTGPTYSLRPRFVPDEEWPLPHDFGEVPVVEFNNKRGSELTDVIPLQNAVNYVIVSSFVAGEFSAIRQKVFMTHAKEPEGGWKNEPGRVWHLPPMLDTDGKPSYGAMGEFAASDLSQYRQIVEMVLQHLALTSKTPVRMFFKSDRGGRGDAPSGESELIEDEPLLDKAQDREVRLGNSWFKVAKLVAKGLGIEGEILGEMIWEDPRSKYRTALLDQAIKYLELGLPIDWIVTQLALAPEDLAELKDLMEKAEAEAEKRAAEIAEQQRVNAELGAGSADAEGRDTPQTPGETAPNTSTN